MSISTQPVRRLLIRARKTDDDAKALRDEALRLRGAGFRLWYAWANDESRRTDGCIKIYYFFSNPILNQFEMVEHMLHRDENSYTSIYSIFEEVHLFEWEMCDFFALTPFDRRVEPGFWLHEGYGNMYPMRYDQNPSDLPTRKRRELLARSAAGRGKLLIGIKHKAINESEFIVAEVEDGHIREVQVFLGYMSGLVELDLQTKSRLDNAVRRLEKLSEPAAVSLGLALSRAIENLPSVNYRTTLETEILREIASRMAAIVNNIFDVDTLFRSIFITKHNASELSLIVDELVKLNVELCGSPFLMGLVCPGGIRLTQDFDLRQVATQLHASTEHFFKIVSRLAYDDDLRERTIGIGVLTLDDAKRKGAVGNVAHAAGIVGDFREQYRYGVYQNNSFRNKFSQALRSAARLSNLPDLQSSAFRGDVYSRFLSMAIEVQISARVVFELIEMWNNLGADYGDCYTDIEINPDYAYSTGFGYDYGAAGEYLVWLKGDKLEGVNRVAVCTPSMKNFEPLIASLRNESLDNLPLDVTSFAIVRKEIDK